MITNTTIESVFALDISNIIGTYIELKKDKACCPFHKEKTASFSVNKKLQIYKCFGCGAGGNVVSFVMEYENFSYPEAIKHLAESNNIIVEYETDTAAKDGLDREAKRNRMLQYHSILHFATAAWSKLGPNALGYLKQRGLSTSSIRHYNLAHAPQQWQHITNEIAGKGWLPQAVELGLVKKSEKKGNHYDAYRNRIIFPIHNEYGQPVGFGGRWLPTGNKEEDKKSPKYINSASSPLYNKDKILYNLHRARPAIKEEGGICYLVEGYMDVIGMGAFAELHNVVATCGTALTAEQAKLLHRFAETVYVFYDGDKAGQEATYKAVLTLAKAGVATYIVSKFESAAGKALDPFDVAQDYTPDSIIDNTMHALDWCFSYFFPEGQKLKPEEKSKAVDKICAYIALENGFIQEDFIKEISKKLKTKIAVIRERVNAMGANISANMSSFEIDESITKYPKEVDKEFFFKHRFAPINNGTGYYFMADGGKGYYKVGNFVLKPLFHIYGEDNKRYVEIQKGKKHINLLMDSRAFGGPDSFGNTLWEEGGLVFTNGNKRILDTLKEYWSDKFPLCYELKQLGWQQEGFFAFSNQVYNGRLSQYNDLGIYDHEGINFLSPSITEDMKALRQTDNIYENDKFLSYNKSKISLTEWLKLFTDVYAEHATYGIAYTFLTAFRDIANRRGQIPFLYAYGKIETGKSKFLESVLYFFFSGKDGLGRLMSAFNLSTGTDYAFAHYMDRFHNCPVLYNEFDENMVVDNRFAAIKAAYDGEGRSKGSGIKNKTITQKVNCTLMLAGQFLNTKDDNSVVSRSILCSFKNKQYNNEEITAFDSLKKHEQTGLSSLLCDLLKHRASVDDRFDVAFNQCREKFRNRFAKESEAVSNRVLQNYNQLYTMLYIMDEYVSLPFTIDQAFNQFAKDMIETNKIVQSSDSLAEFWSYVSTMVDNRVIDYGFDIKLEKHQQLQIRFDKKTELSLNWTGAKDLLFLQVGNVHKAYELEVSRRRKIGLNETTLKKYLKETPAFVGRVDATTFKSARDKSKEKRTSAYVFDYKMLGITISTVVEEPPSVATNAQEIHLPYAD